jgi:hypothetical protein
MNSHEHESQSAIYRLQAPKSNKNYDEYNSLHLIYE